MEIHQLLRHIKAGTPICIFDIAGVCIRQVATKEDISVDLYEYNILDIGVGTAYIYNNKKSCIYITIQK